MTMTCSSYQCPVCAHVYDEAQGDPRWGLQPGTAWNLVPEGWFCPDCAVSDKRDFLPLHQSRVAGPLVGRVR
jgi:rubredoxin